MTIEDTAQELRDDGPMQWQPVITAPYGADLEVAVINGTGTHALVFPCRRGVYGWIDAASGEFVEVHPSHWRQWDDGVNPCAVRSAP
jgi:hypothetical protein